MQDRRIVMTHSKMDTVLLSLALLVALSGCESKPVESPSKPPLPEQREEKKEDKFGNTKMKLERWIEKLKTSQHDILKDWLIHYDIKRSDSLIFPYDGLIYLTYRNGYEACYTYQLDGSGSMKFMKSGISKTTNLPPTDEIKILDHLGILEWGMKHPILIDAY